MEDCTLESAKVKAFLQLIRFAEHHTDDPKVYYTLYGGQTFIDTDKHPNKPVKHWGHTSTAAGAYQILYGTWLEAKQKGIVPDFSPDSQDRIAFAKLKERGALRFVCAGQIKEAIGKLRKEWTSLPGAAQSEMTMKAATEKYDDYVKLYSK